MYEIRQQVQYYIYECALLSYFAVVYFVVYI